ncbi:uncharacterized protein LOC127750172 isoform X2 [Frankliniella occidentalis]|nr:uncharacterized protein LOC127750172 isoform X2 [Frankliniella occidentalis]
MPAFELVFLALIIQRGVHSKSIHSIAGPYIIYFDRLYACEPIDPTLPWRHHFRLTRYNPYKPSEAQLLTGNLTGELPIDDSCWGKMNVALWANNQWKDNAFVVGFKDTVCSRYKENAPSLWELFFKGTEEKGKVGCLIKPGFYEYKNVPARVVFPNVPVGPYGRYKMSVWVGKADKMYYCFVGEFRLVPKLD